MGTWVAEQEAPVNNIAGSAQKYSSGWRYIFSFRNIVLIDGRSVGWSVDGWVGRSFGRSLTRRRRCWPFPRPGIVLVRSCTPF